MKKTFLAIILLASLASCKDKKDTSAAGTEKTGPDIAQTATTTSSSDSADIHKVIIDFYSWYNTHYQKLMDYKLYSGIKKPDMPPYKINWDVVAKYQAYIHDSIPQLGSEFLVQQKRKFEQCDSAFKIDVKDELPYGMDYDWFTNSQEDPAWLLDGLKASTKWVMNIKGDNASVEIGTPENKNYVSGSLLLYVGLKKENGQWKIAEIGND